MPRAVHPPLLPCHLLPLRYGFRGFYDRKAKPVVLTKKAVEGIHLEGGTMLGTSRGGADLRHGSCGWAAGSGEAAGAGGSGEAAGAVGLREAAGLPGRCCRQHGVTSASTCIPPNRCAPLCLPARRQIVKQIDLWGIDMVFVVGGNGGNAGAAAIQEELEKNNIMCRCACPPAGGRWWPRGVWAVQTPWWAARRAGARCSARDYWWHARCIRACWPVAT